MYYGLSTREDESVETTEVFSKEKIEEIIKIIGNKSELLRADDRQSPVRMPVVLLWKTLKKLVNL